MKGAGSYSFQRLEVWQEAIELVQVIYNLTARFPKDEWYGLVTQLRRAAVSIPVNVAEGRGRFHKKEQVQFFYNARGSLYEIVTLLTLALQLDYLDQHDYAKAEAGYQRVLSKLSGLINSLKASHPSPYTHHPSPTT